MLGIPIHVLVIHFPIALILGALLCDLRGDHEAGYTLNLWAGAGSIAAILTGLVLTGVDVAKLSAHAGAGVTGGIVTVILSMLRYTHRTRGDNPKAFPAGLLLVELLAVLGIVVAAITGHRIVLGL